VEAGEGAGLSQFVEREFREFLTCGAFEDGFARFQCEGCAREHFVPISCKGRGFCPSCGGRRMTEQRSPSWTLRSCEFRLGWPQPECHAHGAE
jgi:hypothetical protein